VEGNLDLSLGAPGHLAGLRAEDGGPTSSPPRPGGGGGSATPSTPSGERPRGPGHPGSTCLAAAWAADAEVLTLRDLDHIQIELVGEANDEGWVPWTDGPVPRATPSAASAR
jgi:hypothetical protein